MSPLGSPIVLQRKGSVYGANVPMITGEMIFYQSNGLKQLSVKSKVRNLYEGVTFTQRWLRKLKGVLRLAYH